MRVFILALDGLSYELVNLWNLKHLKQQQCGKIPSIINEKHGEPLSPQVWGSFITGVVQDINDWNVYTKPVEWIRWNTPLNRIRGSGWLVGKTYGKRILIPILNAIKRQKKYSKDSGLNGVSMFDSIPKSIAVNVPMYNLDSEWLFGCTKKILEGDFEAYEKQVRTDNELMIQEMFRQLPEDWDLFMSWIPTADQMGHVFIRNSKKFKNVYKSLDMLASNVSSRLTRDCLLIIVSDHGMKISSDGVSGCHSNHAFYSFNKKIAWEPKKITDFYDFIKLCVMGE